MQKTFFLVPVIGLIAAVGLAACDVPGSMSASPTPSPLSETGSEVIVSPTPDTSLMTPSPVASPTDNGQGVMVGGALMVKDKNIVANAMAASNFTTAVAALKATGLDTTLSGRGPYTVFAPTDDAFTKLPAGTVDTLMKPENKVKLTNLLKYHVVAGSYTTANLKDGQKLKTLEGESLTISNQNGQWAVKDASGNTSTILTPDVMSSNGVTFVVDTVLMPKNQ